MRAVFLDRDGVISENRRDHVKSWDEFEFIPGALSALRTLRRHGFRTFIVTNQAIVGRGVISAATLDDIHARMLAAIGAHGGAITDLCYCPHDTAEGCECRKPRPGMLQRLAARWDVALEQAYMIGDAWTDIEAGNAAGCQTVLVRTGRGVEQLCLPEIHHVDHIASHLAPAVGWILEREHIVAHHDQATQLAEWTRSAPLALGR